MMNDNNKMMVCDHISAFTDKQLTRLKFVEVNNLLRKDKERAKQRYQDSLKAERLQFFPFTHGEFYEQQRNEHNAQRAKACREQEQQENEKIQERKAWIEANKMDTSQDVALKLAARYENQKLEDKAKRDLYEAAKKRGASFDESVQQIEKTAKMTYLMPEWQEEPKNHYMGPFTKYQRYGNLEAYKQNYVDAVNRHEQKE